MMTTFNGNNIVRCFILLTYLIHFVLSESKNVNQLKSEEEKNIIGGQLAVLGQFPFLVSIHAKLKEGKGQGRFCGGSILNERIVITAAHCFKHPIGEEYFFVVGGQVYMNSMKKEHAEHRQQVRIANIIDYPDYEPAITHNDISIMETESPFVFNEFVKPIPLTKGEPAPGTVCQTAGWGMNGSVLENNGSCMFIDIKIQEHKECKYLGNYKEEIMLCAFAKLGVDTCQGDSGGPLICNSLLTGLVSFGPECGTGMPGVYTNVYNYLSWIREIVEEEEDEIKTEKPTANPNNTADTVVNICTNRKEKLFFVIFLYLLLFQTII